jgi:hypothetical protein
LSENGSNQGESTWTARQHEANREECTDEPGSLPISIGHCVGVSREVRTFDIFGIIVVMVMLSMVMASVFNLYDLLLGDLFGRHDVRRLEKELGEIV